MKHLNCFHWWTYIFLMLDINVYFCCLILYFLIKCRSFKPPTPDPSVLLDWFFFPLFLSTELEVMHYTYRFIIVSVILHILNLIQLKCIVDYCSNWNSIFNFYLSNTWSSLIQLIIFLELNFSLSYISLNSAFFFCLYFWGPLWSWWISLDFYIWLIKAGFKIFHTNLSVSFHLKLILCLGCFLLST